MRILLTCFLLFVTSCISAQTINWQPDGNREAQRIRSVRFMGAPIRDTIGGVGFSDRDSIGALLQHPNGGFFIKDRYGWQPYLNKAQNDLRYVLSPSGKITSNWLTAWDFAIAADVPNIANPDTRYLIVNGTRGDTVFTVSGGTGTGDFTPNFVGVAYSSSANRYFTFFVVRQPNGTTYHIDRPLKYNLSSDTLRFIWDDYQGQHMTGYGYYAYADMIYDYYKQIAAKDYKLYSFYPEDNGTVPFTSVNGAVQGGFIPSTSIPQVLSISTATINYAQKATMHYLIQQGGVADRGSEWQVTLGKKNGYVETWVGINRNLPGYARVLFYLDGVLQKIDTVRGAIQKLTYNYSNASTGKIQILTGDVQNTSIRVGSTIWYQTDVPSTTKVYQGGKIMFVGDSWTQYPFIGIVPFQALTNRFKQRYAIDGGNPSDVINVGRGSMTSEWGKYWLKYWLNLHKPSYVFLEFYINDANSSGFYGDPGNTNWNFSSTSPYAAGVDVDGKVTQSIWLANRYSMTDTCIAYGAVPINLMNSQTGSLTQTQGQSGWLSALRPEKQYYDIEAFFTSQVYADRAINSPLATIGRGVIDTTVTKITKGGSETIGGSYLLELQQLNSATAKGLLIYPKVNYTGSLGKLVSVQNNATVGTGEVFSIANNGLTTSAAGFSAGLNGYTTGVFSMTYNGGIARISATNSTTLNFIYIGDSARIVRFGAPITLKDYATINLPASPNADAGSLAYDVTKQRPAHYDGSNWFSLARETDAFARFDSTTAKSRFIQNSLNFTAQTANIWTSGTVRFDLGSDAKYDMYYRDSATGRVIRLPAGTQGQQLTAGILGKPQWTSPVSGVYNYAGPTGNYTVLASDQYIGNIDNTAPAPTFTLPTAATAGVGKWYLIANENLNGNLPITLSQPVALLNGTTTTTVPPGMSIRIMSDGGNWREVDAARRSNIYTLNTATDANYVIPDAATIVVLPVITANRTVTLPALQVGQTLTIHNRNSAAFTWSFTNTNVKDAAGNTITSLINQSAYQFYYDGTNLYKIN